MGKKLKTFINMEYAGIQGTYWMFFGVICSFSSVFLLGNGYSNSEIGMILAGGSLLAIMLQPFVAALADKRSLTNFLLIGAAVFMLLTGSLLLSSSKNIGTPLLFIVLIGGITLMQPIINALSFALSKKGVYINFGLARSVGSLGYSLLVIFLGFLVDRMGIKAIPLMGEIVLIFLMTFIVLIKNHEKNFLENLVDRKDVENIGLLAFLKRNKIFIAFSIGIIGLFFGNAVLNNFMIQIVSSVSGTSKDMGKVFAIMAFLEIPTMIAFDRIRKKVSCKTLIKISSFGFLVKISLCYLAKSMTMIYVAQLAQLMSFGLFLPAMVHFIDEIMTKGEAVKGHSLFIMMTTIGSILASLGGGILLDLKGAKTLLLVSVVVTLAGCMIITLLVGKIPDKNRRGNKLN